MEKILENIEKYNKNNKVEFTIDELHDLYNRGIASGKQHEEPSRKTLEFMDIMNDKMDKLKDDMIKSVVEIKILIAGLPQDLLDKCDLRYAEKALEKKVNGLNSEIDGMKNQGNNRMWEGFKIMLQVLIAIMMAVLLTKIK